MARKADAPFLERVTSLSETDCRHLLRVCNTVSEFCRKLGIPRRVVGPVKEILSGKGISLEEQDNKTVLYRRQLQQYAMQRKRELDNAKALANLSSILAPGTCGKRARGFIHTFNTRLGLLEHKCQECGILPEWRGKKLVLQLDHIDGDNSNNVLSNFRFLCPNCHSQTETFTGRNIKRL